MDEMYANELIGLGRSLTELAVKGTATAISNKIKTIKDELCRSACRSVLALSNDVYPVRPADIVS